MLFYPGNHSNKVLPIFTVKSMFCILLSHSIKVFMLQLGLETIVNRGKKMERPL